MTIGAEFPGCRISRAFILTPENFAEFL
jgi:hypothetical protein